MLNKYSFLPPHYSLVGFLEFFLFLQVGVHVFEHSAFWNPFIPAAKKTKQNKTKAERWWINHPMIASYTQQSIKSFREFRTEFCSVLSHGVAKWWNIPQWQELEWFLPPLSFPASQNLKDGQFRRGRTAFNSKRSITGLKKNKNIPKKIKIFHAYKMMGYL